VHQSEQQFSSDAELYHEGPRVSVDIFSAATQLYEKSHFKRLSVGK